MRFRVALLPLLLSAAAAAGGEIGDPHLDPAPRTAAEAARIAAATAAPETFSKPQPFEGLSAGAATVRARKNADAFSQPAASLSFAQELDFKVGNGVFRKLWVSAPSSTEASDGLGPLFNARACQNCHVKDGRGRPPGGPDDPNAGTTLLKVAVRGADGRQAPHPVYGGQIQDRSTPGVPAEARIDVSWEEFEVALSDGESARLRRPTWRAADPAYGPLGEGAALSPRIAPAMLGMGLLEAIPAADILARADPEDADGDGISGRPALLTGPNGAALLGRFGWKAAQPTVAGQAAAAFSGDMGISSPARPASWGDCTEAEAACRAGPHGAAPGETEIDEEAFALVVFYSRNLGVPARRGEGKPAVLRGKRVFFEAGCAACHAPAFVTHRLPDEPERSFQLIWPWTDMLLHDMGEGLADGFDEGGATGSEWRTAPLWGIGLTERVSGHTYFLHDGRARSLLEAILWHGGEADAARDRVISMPKTDRADLLTFLGSL